MALSALAPQASALHILRPRDPLLRSALLERGNERSWSATRRNCGARCEAAKPEEESITRREIVLRSSSVALLASVFKFGGPQPTYLGVKRDPPGLALCPRTPNCISTSEELDDPTHYVPPWTYNPEDGRGLRKPATQKQAMDELVEVVETLKPDGFVPTIVDKRDDYLYVQYESPFFGFIDDVEFWFPPNSRSRVEYRSASRLGESDLDVNRKRIKAIRQELQKRGWDSTGF